MKKMFWDKETEEQLRKLWDEICELGHTYMYPEEDMDEEPVPYPYDYLEDV